MNLAHGGNLFSIARANGWDWRDVLDLSANINPLGPSPAVRPAIIDAIDRIPHYPDAQASALVATLAQLWNLSLIHI